MKIKLLLLCLMSFSLCMAQDKSGLVPGYYLVVGAYAQTKGDVAQKYAESLISAGHQAGYGFHPTKKLYFVYLQYFDNLKTALSAMSKSRRTFEGSWVSVVSGEITAKPEVIEAVDDIPVKTETSVVVKDKEAMGKEEAVAEAQKVVAVVDDYSDVKDNPEIIQYKQMTLGNTEAFISLYDAKNSRIVEGLITVYDKDRGRQITRVPGNEYLLLPDPKSKTGTLTLVSESFGYKRAEVEINFHLPLSDTVKREIDLMGTTLVINFEMAQFAPGDKAILAGLSFYNEAALMMPESKGDLDALLLLLKENPGYKVILHGHSNGNSGGRILAYADDKNYFSLKGARETVGSSKELSEKRAGIIKSYLSDNGIAADRIQVMGWGGKKPLYDKKSVNSKRNVRVEVEIIK